MKYTAINIGPIIKTLGMARKPRELWAASYLFSYLMKCLIDELPENKIVSPATNTPTEVGVGLYPDRVFVEGEINLDAIEKALYSFSQATELPMDTVKNYFNVMMTSVDCEEVSKAVADLNQKLNCMELFERVTDDKSAQEVWNLLLTKYNSPLFKVAFGARIFDIPDLKQIARNGEKDIKYSYSNYVCVVYADGDNMGKIVSRSNNISDISKALLEFGKTATETIRDYSDYALPIYAGGDDLLFIVPVCSNGKNIFDLIDDLDEKYEDVKKVADSADLQTSMSYGVAVSYYKYPLYEILYTAQNLLHITAKNVQGKNAVALELRKHSGGTFAVQFSKNDEKLKKAFADVVASSSVEESVVSAVSHKIRNNEGILKLWLGDANANERNTYFFRKFMEYDERGTGKDNEYKKKSLNLLNELYKKYEGKQNEQEIVISQLVKTMYGMLRTGKFIKGEEALDE